MMNNSACQVCGKPITDGEMCFEKRIEGRLYFACCPICFSLLQEHPEKHIADRLQQGRSLREGALLMNESLYRMK